MQDNESIRIAAPEAHHPFSPSSLNRLAACPASYKVCKGWASPGTSASERGTLLHRAVYDDKCLALLRGEDREAVEFIRERHIRPYPQEKGFMHFYEQRLELFDENGKEINFGTCDLVMLDATETVAMVKDWKFGNIPVPPARENLQLIDYALSVFQKYPSVHTIFAEVVQPALEQGDDDSAPDKVAEFHREDFDALLYIIKATIERCRNASLDSDGCYNCTPENCRFCNRLGCRIHRQRMEQNFALFKVDGEQASAFAQTEEGMMTVDYANALLLAKKAIEAAMEEKAEMASEVVIAAGGTWDFKVMQGRETRRTDWKAVAEQAGVPQEVIDANTTVKKGAPYLMAKQRRQRLPQSIAAALPEGGAPQ